eukprot:Hpha_TRINITY_DN19718_c0_g1::TRINITY_DN19718_c0_g1_i1::g.21716::m.21716
MSRAEIARTLDLKNLERLCWECPLRLITPEGTEKEVFTSFEIVPGVVYKTVNGSSLVKRSDRIFLNGEAVQRSKQFSHIRRREGTEPLTTTATPTRTRREAVGSDSEGETILDLAQDNARARRGAERILQQLKGKESRPPTPGTPSGWADAQTFGDIEPGLLRSYSGRDDIAEAERNFRSGPRRQNSFGAGMRPPRASRSGRDSMGGSGVAPAPTGTRRRLDSSFGTPQRTDPESRPPPGSLARVDSLGATVLRQSRLSGVSGSSRHSGTRHEPRTKPSHTDPTPTAAPGRGHERRGHERKHHHHHGGGHSRRHAAAPRAPRADVVEVGCDAFETDDSDLSGGSCGGSSSSPPGYPRGGGGRSPPVDIPVMLLKELRRIAGGSKVGERERISLRHVESLLRRLQSGGEEGATLRGGERTAAECTAVLQRAAAILREAGAETVAAETEQLCASIHSGSDGGGGGGPGLGLGLGGGGGGGPGGGGGG